MTDLIDELSLGLQNMRQELTQHEARLNQLMRILGQARGAFRECREKIIPQLYHVENVATAGIEPVLVIAQWRAPRQIELNEMDYWGRYNHENHADELQEERALKAAVGQLKRQIEAAKKQLEMAKKKRVQQPKNDTQMRLF